MDTKLQARPTLDQRRAKHAWEAVQKFLDAHKDDEDRKKFGNHAKKLPTRILTSGLGQALAFLEAKREAPALVEALNDWIDQRRKAPTEDRRLMVRVIDGDADFLRFATAESLAYLQWLTRFAEAQKLTDAGGTSDGP